MLAIFFRIFSAFRASLSPHFLFNIRQENQEELSATTIFTGICEITSSARPPSPAQSQDTCSSDNYKQLTPFLAQELCTTHSSNIPASAGGPSAHPTQRANVLVIVRIISYHAIRHVWWLIVCEPPTAWPDEFVA